MAEDRGESRTVAVLPSMSAIAPQSIDTRSFSSSAKLLHRSLMFALEADNILYLKADEETVRAFRAKGLEAFTYIKQGKPCSLSYYQAPEEALESSAEMDVWANRAYGAALRAAARKSRTSKN